MKFIFGPLEIKKKVSDVFNDINYGKNEQTQIIHCDRIRKRNSQ